MNIPVFFALVPFLGFFFQIGTHLFLGRVFNNISPWKALFIGFCSSVAGTLSLIAYVTHMFPVSLSDLLAIMILDVSIVGSLGFCYFTFVNLNYTSLRIKLLREFAEQDSSSSEILQKYSEKVILKKRLARLVQAQELIFDGQYYYPGVHSNFSTINVILKWFKNILCISQANHEILFGIDDHAPQ